MFDAATYILAKGAGGGGGGGVTPEDLQQALALKQNKYITRTVTLTSAGWSGSTLSQTVAAQGVSETNLVQVSPVPTDTNVYLQSRILCTQQGTNTLTFTAETQPAQNISVTVVIWEE